MRVLFISKSATIKTGGTALTERNLKVLQEMGHEVDRFPIALQAGKLQLLKSMLKLNMEGLNDQYLAEIKNILPRYDLIFIDSSLHGKIAKTVKENSKVPVIVYFHNIESDYFAQLLKYSRKPQHLLSVITARHNEKVAARYADALIALNKRDAQLMQQQYGRYPDSIIPISLPEAPMEVIPADTTGWAGKLLFVGSNFFPNNHGLQWFIDNVFTKLPADFQLTIAGSVKVKVPANPADANRVHQLGYVNNLQEAYSHADIVILPIFKGAGMKAKTAEAFMHGKCTVGTTEAYEGYNDLPWGNAVYKCNSAADFLNTLTELQQHAPAHFNTHIYNYFEEHLSEKVVIEHMKNIFAKLALNV